MTTTHPITWFQWVDAEGAVIATAALWENTVKDADLTQVFRLVSYPQNYAGVRALSPSG